MSDLSRNLATRWRLLRLALLRRFVYDDIVEMALAYGPPIRDAVGNVTPAELLARLTGRADLAAPDFSALRAEDVIREDSETRNWSSEPSVARAVGQFVHLRRATTVLEIGCFVGWTTVHIATALRALGGGCVHHLDADAGHLAAATANLARLGLADRARAYHGLSTSAATLAALPAAADLVFIDTTHQFAQTCEEIELYARRLTPGGCLVLHDSLSMPGVRRAVQHVQDRFDVFTCTTERSNGLSVLLPRPAGGARS